jgi:hypothetical protein
LEWLSAAAAQLGSVRERDTDFTFTFTLNCHFGKHAWTFTIKIAYLQVADKQNL